MGEYGTEWSREELILAFHAYCQIPFAKTKASNPDVIALADLIGRTPSSAARKLGNFGAFDPTLAQKGISGLQHVGKADKAIWEEFYGNWDALVRESQTIRTNLGVTVVLPLETVQPFRIPDRATERQGTAKQRVYQDFFRRSVLASYDATCCVCQCDLSPLLVASHIIPWSLDVKNRLNPENGLCLCLLHDGAFDRGLLAVTDTFHIQISKSAKSSKSSFVQDAIVQYDSRPIFMPRRFRPRQEFLDWHGKNVFVA